VRCIIIDQSIRINALLTLIIDRLTRMYQQVLEQGDDGDAADDTVDPFAEEDEWSDDATTAAAKAAARSKSKTPKKKAVSADKAAAKSTPKKMGM